METAGRQEIRPILPQRSLRHGLVSRLWMTLHAELTSLSMIAAANAQPLLRRVDVRPEATE